MIIVLESALRQEILLRFHWFLSALKNGELSGTVARLSIRASNIMRQGNEAFCQCLVCLESKRTVCPPLLSQSLLHNYLKL